MTVSVEFQRLVWAFHEFTIPDPFNESQWIAASVAHLDAATKIGAREFIEKLIRSVRSPEKIREVWESANPEYSFPDPAHVPVFLHMVLEELMKPEHSK